MFSQALANELGAAYSSFNIEDYLTMWFGQTERQFIQAFETFESFCRERDLIGIAYFDEAEQIFADRRSSDGGVKATKRIASYLLKKMDGENAAKNIIFVASTNLIDYIDKAFLRAGRFDYKIYVGEPSVYDLVHIIKAQERTFNERAKKPFLEIKEKEPLAVYMYIYQFVGADVREVLRRATELKIRELIVRIEKDEDLKPEDRFVDDDYVWRALGEYDKDYDLEEAIKRCEQFGLEPEKVGLPIRRSNRIGFMR